MNTTTLSYQGTLVLESRSRRSIARNSGTSNLFKLLTEFLCKEDLNTMRLPTYMMLYRCPSKELVKRPTVSANKTKELLHVLLDIENHNALVERDILYTANFQTTIDAHMLAPDPDIASNEKLCLGLISGDKESILASVDFDMETYTILRNGGQSLVTWILAIANSDEIINEAIDDYLGG